MTFAIRPPRLHGQIPRGPLRIDWSNGLSAGLKAFWTFDATQGGFVDVAWKQPITQTGNPTIVPAAGGIPAVSYNGSSQYISSASNQFYDANDLVVVVGVTPRGSIVALSPIITRWNETGNLRCWSIVCATASGDIRGDMSITGTAVNQTTTTGTGQLVVNKRIVVGYLIQGSNRGTNQPAQTAIWIDGARQSQNTSATANLRTGVNLPVEVCHSPFWGAAQRFGHYDVDFVAIWNRYLMPAQLSSLTRDPGQILMASQPMAAGFVPAAPIPYEWGFQPVLPDAQRDWFMRAAAGMPGSNIEAPLFSFLPAGWEIQPPQPPHRGSERVAASLPAALDNQAPFIFLAAPIPHEWGFESQPPQPPRRRWESAAASLPAGLNIEAVFSFVDAPIPHEWGFENQPPQPPRWAWERTAASLPAGLNIEAEFIFVSASVALEWGFENQPPQPPLRLRWAKAGSILPAAININANFAASTVPFERGWAIQPLLLPRRRWERLAASLPAAFNVSTLSPRQRPQILVIIG